MYEVFFVVVVLIIIFLLLFLYNAKRDKFLILEGERKLNLIEEKMHIAEKKYFQGKIKRNVFDFLKEDFEEEKLSVELGLFRLKGSAIEELSFFEKEEQLVSKFARPTKFKRKKVQKLLRESELLKREMSLLEGRFLKREISQNVFERLMRKKENQLIQKESEIVDFVRRTNEQ